MAEKNTGPSDFEAPTKSEDILVLMRRAFEANQKLIHIHDPRASKMVDKTLACMSEISRHIKRLQLDRAKMQGRK